MNNHRKFFKKTDLLLIGGLCVLALILLLVVTLSSPKGTTAQIYLHDVCVMTCDLSEDSIFQIDQAPEVTFQIQDGKIRFLSSDCPDQVSCSDRLYQPCRANRCTVFLTASSFGLYPIRPLISTLSYRLKGIVPCPNLFGMLCIWGFYLLLLSPCPGLNP
ncbi:MAG: NusG domain II-containing protein [Clostridia bacterium]